jgi:chromosomal replication initiation ATPase DnaA
LQPANPEQLPLPLAPAASTAWADLVTDDSNRAALAWLETPGRWPQRRLALHGPSGTGKSHMLRALANRHGWRLLAGAQLTEPEALRDGVGVALDDAEAAPAFALLHLLNRSAEQGAPLLLAAREAPSRWPVALPDLVSRLRATLAVGIGAPSDTLLQALLVKQLADRQLRVAPDVQAYLLARLPRQAGAIGDAVAALDRAALAHGAAITRPFARSVLGLHDIPAAEPPGRSRDDEGLV